MVETGDQFPATQKQKVLVLCTHSWCPKFLHFAFSMRTKTWKDLETSTRSVCYVLSQNETTATHHAPGKHSKISAERTTLMSEVSSPREDLERFLQVCLHDISYLVILSDQCNIPPNQHKHTTPCFEMLICQDNLKHQWCRETHTKHSNSGRRTNVQFSMFLS